MSDYKPMTHKQYMRWVRKNLRTAPDRTGVLTFCVIAVIVIICLIGFGLLWVVNK